MASSHAVASGVDKEKAGILVDEQFGAAILRDARTQGYVTACPAEKSGQEEFDLSTARTSPNISRPSNQRFARLLVRYNPEGDQALNRRQSNRLSRLSEYLYRQESRSSFCLSSSYRRRNRSSIASKATRKPTTLSFVLD